jgi:hypothetical protein
MSWSFVICDALSNTSFIRKKKVHLKSALVIMGIAIHVTENCNRLYTTAVNNEVESPATRQRRRQQSQHKLRSY